MSGVVTQNVLDGSGLVKASAAGGAWTFIKKLTASGSGTLSFVNGVSDVVLDSTYKEYIFYLVNIHPATDMVAISFQVSTDTGSNYNTTITSNAFRSYNHESSSGYLSYDGSSDLAQSTSFQVIAREVGNDADQAASAYVHLFNPSDTTFAKPFFVRSNHIQGNDISNEEQVSGYFNTTSAVDAIQFKFSSGNIDTGSIIMQGLST